jgi:hypothetical protein
MMGDHLDGREREEAACSPDGVKGAEDASEQACIFCVLLERN